MVSDLPALVVGSVQHRRNGPIRHDISFRTYQWLVDVDHLPKRWPFATFRGEDYLGGEPGPLRAAVADAAAPQTLEADDRIVMLTGARCLGHTFNPLTVFWCLAPDGAIRWALLEIHNTYGGRHTQLLQLDDSGRAHIPKEFYVSPFLSVDGSYDVQLTLTEVEVGVSVRLRQHDVDVFAARFLGRPHPATGAALAQAILRTPLVMHQVTARIHAHAVWLWLRRLPIVPRTLATGNQGRP